MLTDQELDIIRERLRQATVYGSWIYDEPDGGITVYVGGSSGNGMVTVFSPSDAEPPPDKRWQGAFIANAPSDIEMLLKHIAELESILRDMQDDSLAYQTGVKDGAEEERMKGDAASRPHSPDWSPGRNYD